ncbi:MAG: hypothetical protein H6732_05745 [Alphaproteobacteria bacterium]|nr:hypothetical protein [Alphaproteobacteria bacterium]
MTPARPALLVAGLLVAAPALAQQRPSIGVLVLPPSQEGSAGCAVPTKAECYDPAYLETACGELQYDHTWTCHGIWYAEGEAREDDLRLSAVPRSASPSGVKKVIRSATPAAPTGRTFTPSAYRFTSQQAAHVTVGSDQEGIDVYGMWDANGVEVTSCRELVYETFYDVNVFQRATRGKAHDPRAMVEVAFGPAGNPASLATRHLGDPWLRGKDGVPFGKLFGNTQEVRNAFLELPDVPLDDQGQATAGAPSLRWSLYHHSFGGKLLLALLGQIPEAKRTHLDSWARQELLEEALSWKQVVPPGNGPGLNLPLKAVAPPSGPLLPEDLPLAMPGSGIQGAPPRKYLDTELDELEEVQKRYRRALAQWAELNRRYEGSGWEPTVLAPAPQGQGGGLVVQGLTNKTQGGGKAPGLLPQLPLASKPPPPTETQERRALLERMVTLFFEASEAGCVSESITPCDWSPRRFVSRLAYTWSAEQDAALTACDEFSGGDLANLRNLDVTFVDEEVDGEVFFCRVTTGNTLTPKVLRKLTGDVKACRAEQVAYHEAVAAFEQAQLDAAKAAAMSHPELVDESTGEVRGPRRFERGGDDFGGKYFGLSYDYEFGYRFDFVDDICSIDAYGGGHFRTDTRVFGHTVEIVDGEAFVDTDRREAHAHLRLLGVDLFTPIDQSWAQSEPWTWSTSSGIMRTKTIPVVKTVIVIVIVPVKFEIGVSGSFSYLYGLQAKIVPPNAEQCPGITAGGFTGPMIGLWGYLEAGVDVFIAGAGVRGSVEVISAGTLFKLDLGLVLQAGGNASEEAQVEAAHPLELALLISTGMDLKLSTLSGKIEAYAYIGFCQPLCKEASEVIVSWNGPHWDKPIFQHDVEINLATLDLALFGL